MRANFTSLLTTTVLVLFYGVDRSHSVNTTDLTLARAPEKNQDNCDLFPACCDLRQSPVDLHICDAKEERKPLQLTHFQQAPQMTLRNTGSRVSMSLNFTAERTPTVKGAGIPGEYLPALGFLLWDSTDDRGSEHALNGVKYPLEIQIFARNLKYTPEEALTNVDGFVALAILGKKSTKPLKARNHRGIASLAAELTQIQEANTETEVQTPPHLSKLLPLHKDKFYKYSGSLPFPICFQTVTWIVFTSPVPVTDVELTLLRQLRNTAGVPITNIARPLQPLNSRPKRFRGVFPEPGQLKQCKTAK